MARAEPQKKDNKPDPLQFVKDKIEAGENWYILRQVMINRAFYNSQQWIAWNKQQNVVFVPEIRPGEKRMTFNKIKPAILTLLAKLSKNRIKLEVTADTNDQKRIEVAKAALKYLKYQYDKDKMDAKSRRLKFHMLVDGFPTLKVYVDKTKGAELNVTEEMAELAKESGLEDAPTQAGEICTQVCDQFVILVDPNAESHEEIGWCVERRPEDVDDIKEIWGAEVAVESNISMRQSFDTGYNGNVAIGREIKRFQHHAFVNDYWEWPCAKYPKGRRIVTAGDKVLLKTEDPGTNPFIFFPAIPVPGTAIATGVVTDMTTPQRSYNIKRTAEARILEEMGNPMWINPNGATEDDELTNEIGGIVHAAGQEMPSRVPGVEPGNGWQAAMERDEADLEDISGAHEISQGSAQKGNTTLGGLQLQVEQDETKLALLVQSYEDGMKEWGQKVLELVKAHFPEEQQLSIVGENGEIEAFDFMGEDLSGGEVVDVIPNSSMPTLKAVQDQKIIEMWGAGMFVDPNTGMPDHRKVVRMLGEEVAAQYFDDTEIDSNKALMEQRIWETAFADPATAQALVQYSTAQQQYKMDMQAYQAAQQEAALISQEAGVPPMQLPEPEQPQPPVKLPIVRDFYDHIVHIEQHDRYRKSDDYDKLPPELQGIVDDHVAEHKMMMAGPTAMAAQQQGQAMQQQATQQAQSEQQAQQATQAAQAAEKDKDRAFQAQQAQQSGNNALKIAAMRGGPR